MVIFHCYVNVYQRVWNMYEPSMGIYGNRWWRSTDISMENYGNLNYGFSLCFHMGWIDGRLWNIWQEKHSGHLNFEIMNLIDKHILGKTPEEWMLQALWYHQGPEGLQTFTANDWFSFFVSMFASVFVWKKRLSYKLSIPFLDVFTLSISN